MTTFEQRRDHPAGIILFAAVMLSPVWATLPVLLLGAWALPVSIPLVALVGLVWAAWLLSDT